MSTGDWTDDEHEPLAPLPAHERPWRHPSEIGDHEWRMSEPPIAIGRGLTVTTGMIGSLLVFAILWTVVPSPAGRGTASGIGATVVTLGSDSVVEFSGSESTGAGLSAEASGGVTTLFAKPTPNATSATTAPALTRPRPTFEVHSTMVRTGGSPAEASAPMIAVPVEGGTLLITTAPAVAAGTEVEITFADGDTGRATVVVVDQRTGLAVLAPEAGHSTEAFEVATEVQPGDELTVLGDEAVSVTVGDEGADGAEVASDNGVPEGAPVVNDRGELVALCTHDASGTARLVTLETLDQIRRAMSTTEAPVWIGVVINDDPAHELSVGAVDPEGPAAAAGLETGDVIIAVDDVPLADCDALIALLATHRPGDMVRLTVRGADGELRDVDVELAEPKTEL